jgi:hypothetical protein
MLATNYLEGMFEHALHCAELAPDPTARAYWLDYANRDAAEIGAVRVLWFEAQPCV